MPPKDDIRHLYGKNEPPSGIYRIEVAADGTFVDASKISSSVVISGDVIFTNGMNNGFRAAVRNGTAHLHQAGLLTDSYVLNFNPTRGFVPDILEASRDIAGAHTGLTHSTLARGLADALHAASLRGVTGLQLVGHSQGGAITASALRYAGKAGLSLRSLAGGGVSLHGAPVNAWMARTRLLDRAVRLLDVVPRASLAAVTYAGLDPEPGDAAWGHGPLPAFLLVRRREWAKVLPGAADLAESWDQVRRLSRTPDDEQRRGRGRRRGGALRVPVADPRLDQEEVRRRRGARRGRRPAGRRGRARPGRRGRRRRPRDGPRAAGRRRRPSRPLPRWPSRS